MGPRRAGVLYGNLTSQHTLCLPNPFVEGKGHNGSLEVAERKTCYDGALGARDMHNLQSFGAATRYYNNGCTISATFYRGGLPKMFTTDPNRPKAPGGEL